MKNKKNIIIKHLSCTTLLVVLSLFLGMFLGCARNSSVSTKVTILPEDRIQNISNIQSPQTIDDLIKNSDVAVIGTVSKVLAPMKRELFPGSREAITTDVIIKVDRFLFGGPESPNVAVCIRSGRIGNEVTIFENEPELTEGEDVLLFLSRSVDKLSPPEDIESSSYYLISASGFGKYLYNDGMAKATYDDAPTSEISINDLQMKITDIRPESHS